MRNTLEIVEGIVVEKARLYVVSRYKVRFTIIYLSMFCLVFLVWLNIRCQFFSVFRFFLAFCCLISLLVVNIHLLYFHIDTIRIARVIQTSFVFDPKRTAHWTALPFTNIFSLLHYVLLCKDALFCLSNTLLQSRLFKIQWNLDVIGYV